MVTNQSIRIRSLGDAPLPARQPCAVLVFPVDQEFGRCLGVAEQLTLSGAFVATAELPPVGSVVRLKLVLRGAGTIRAAARVVRVAVGRGFSCCFAPLRRDARELLARYLGPDGGLAPVAGTIGG